ncbi:hypothetical protein [Flavobacterium polysaccharolyticum]|uniref:Lipoprotein n=1 Tax=Flavobacterium polysaccharolyticum TaxID=3133148 RepID=A0ABU9NQF5_9FLAO
MRNYKALMFLFFILSCKNNSKNIIIEQNSEIKKVIECVIMDDSLNILRSDSIPIPLSKELNKLKVYRLKMTNNKRPPKPEKGIYLEDLFYYRLDNKFIPEKDSLYLLNQNESVKTYVIENTFQKKINLTTFKEQKDKRKANKNAEFVYLTFPIFSSDNAKAYLEIVNVCFGDCGSGQAVYLEKKNGKWQIVYEHQLWVG